MKTYLITVNGKIYEVDVVVKEGKKSPVIVSATPAAPAAAAPATAAPVVATPMPVTAPTVVSSHVVSAPMPGTIISIAVTEGQQVAKGDLLLVFEAMKMENELFAPYSGIVEKVHIQKGAAIQTDDALISFR